MFGKKDFEMLKNTICAKTLFFVQIKKHPTGLTTGGVLKKICLTKILF